MPDHTHRGTEPADPTHTGPAETAAAGLAPSTAATPAEPPGVFAEPAGAAADPPGPSADAPGAGRAQTPAQAMLEQLGGWRGLVYSSLPVLVFVPVSSAFGLTPAIVAALTAATLILVWRLVRRETVQPAVSGFFAVGVCVLIAFVMGETRGYFLLGIWGSLLWAGVFGLSVLVRRPLVGYAWAWVTGQDTTWRRLKPAVRVFDVATLVWVAVFAARFVVQNRLYDADETGWLGVARIAMGWPLTALAALVTYFAIKSAQRTVRAHAGDPARTD